MIAMALAFVIFRFFDITKLGPIDKSQNFPHGVGVVLDDFLAGIIGNFLLVCIWTIFF
jgi:phosphatidylglycerophosphatase A